MNIIKAIINHIKNTIPDGYAITTNHYTRELTIINITKHHTLFKPHLIIHAIKYHNEIQPTTPHLPSIHLTEPDSINKLDKILTTLDKLDTKQPPPPKSLLLFLS